MKETFTKMVKNIFKMMKALLSYVITACVWADYRENKRYLQKYMSHQRV